MLRRAVGEDAVQSDARQVHRGAMRWSWTPNGSRRWSLAGKWREAADLVEGEFLEGFGVPGASDFEDWLRQEREAWRRLGSRP